MYNLSKNNENRVIGARNTRQNDKYVFRMDTKVGTKYSHSPFYRGCKLWDLLPKETQFSETKFSFNQLVKPLYKTFDKDYLL